MSLPRRPDRIPFARRALVASPSLLSILLLSAASPAGAQLLASPEVRNYQVVTQTTASDSASTKSLTVSVPPARPRSPAA